MPKKSSKCPMPSITKSALRTVYAVVTDGHESIEEALNDYGAMTLAEAKGVYKDVCKESAREVNWCDEGTTWGVAMVKISHEVVESPVYFTANGENN